MNCKIVKYDKDTIQYLPHDEQPFNIIGKLILLYDGNEWITKEELFEDCKEKTYPNDVYDPLVYIDNDDEVAFLAINNGELVGSIRVCKRWNGNAFIDDLKVDRIYRNNGIGKMLIDAAVKWSKEKGLNGLSLETQAENLLACRFYLKYGFEIGGIDTMVYTNPLYKRETALYFYLPDELYHIL